MHRLFLILILLVLGLPAWSADVPDWVLNPDFPGGIAAAECVTYTGAMSIDRQQAVAAARVALAQQVGVRVKAVDKLFVERVSSNDRAKTKTSFEAASQQLTDQTLNNSRIVKTEIVKHPFSDDQLCVLVAMTPEATREFFKDMVKVANANLPSELENELFESFRVKGSGKP
jgi:hypothetical protein